MKALNMVFVTVIVLVFCFTTVRSVEVYKAGPDGKASWHETSEMRDRSLVPTPSLSDKLAYRRRSKIPVPHADVSRSRSSSIPRPSQEDIENYRRRSEIPVIKLSNKQAIKIPMRRAASRRYFSNQKKSIINRILFSIPFGAQFPIYFASRTKKGNNKKSKVIAPVQSYNVPAVRSFQPWRLPTNYNTLANRKYNSYVPQQTITRQNVMPLSGPVAQGQNFGYYNPRSYYASTQLNNRNSIPLYQTYPSYAAPQPQYYNYIKRISRSDKSLDKWKGEEQSRKAVINRDF